MTRSQHGREGSRFDIKAFLYDKLTDTWSTAPETPWPLNHGAAGTATFPVGSPNEGLRTVIAGGVNEKRVEIFDPTFGLWTPSLNGLPNDIFFATMHTLEQAFENQS